MAAFPDAKCVAASLPAEGCKGKMTAGFALQWSDLCSISQKVSLLAVISKYMAEDWK